MNYKDVNDYELLYMASDVSDESIELVLEKYRPVIQQQIWKWLPLFKKTGLEFEDVEQEICYAIVMAMRNYDDEQSASLYTYFLKVIDNTMKYLLRVQGAKKNLLLNEAISLSTPCQENIELEDILTDLDISVENKLEEYRLQDFVYQFFYHLTINQAEIFELYVSGFDFQAIEILLTLEKGQTSKILFRIRKKLKSYLIKNGYSL